MKLKLNYRLRLEIFHGLLPHSRVLSSPSNDLPHLVLFCKLCLVICTISIELC